MVFSGQSTIQSLIPCITQVPVNKSRLLSFIISCSLAIAAVSSSRPSTNPGSVRLLKPHPQCPGIPAKSESFRAQPIKHRIYSATDGFPVLSAAAQIASGADSPGGAARASENINSRVDKYRLASQILTQTGNNLAEDEIFGTYEGYNLDQYLFRDDGPILFPINITRVISKNKQGFRDLIVGQPQLVLRVWDVDASCGSACYGCCEVDNVYINGRFLGTLDGANDSWSTCRFNIPVDWFQDGTIKDATYQGSGMDPIPGENWIQIDIDTVCGSCWAVECDYGEIQVQSMRPAVLIHGIFSLPSMWDTFKTFIPGNLGEAFPVDGTGDTFDNGSLIRSTHLPNAMKGFGVKKVNFITHSKGGLDTSVAIMGNGDKVDNLITLGSPLLGTEYADHFIQAHPTLTGVVKGWTGKILHALSTSTRADYYRTNASSEPGVKEYHFAGDQYAATDTTCLLGRLLFWHNVQIFNVRNDGWVPVDRSFPIWRSSADKTGPNSHTDDPNLQPKHPAPPSAMTSDPAVGQWAVEIMRNSVAGTAAKSEYPKSVSFQSYLENQSSLASSAAPQQSSAISATLTAGQTKNFSVPIDSTVSEMRFYLGFDPSTADVQVTLISPSGGLIPILRNPDFPGFSYVTSNPGAGTWSVQVHTANDVTVQGAMEFETSLTLAASADKNSYASGEAIHITANLTQAGLQRAGASVKAYFSNLSGYSDSVQLTDQGAGTYAGIFVPAAGGVFTVCVVASGTVSGSTFERAVYIPSINVSPATARISSILSESANDTDGNGLYNNLTIQARIQVQTEGDYWIVGILGDSQGALVARAVFSSHLTSGLHDIGLIFDGTVIRNSAKNGPYKLTQLTIHDLKQQGLATDTKTNLYTTAAYKFYQFEGPVLAFGSGSEFVTDLDRDGHYDSLTVKLEISVNPGYAGTYAFNAQLQAPNGSGIDWYSNPSQSLVVGLNTIQLTYSGTAIARAGLNGPYRVGDFHLYNLDNSSIALSSPNVYTTSAYRACQFQGGGTCASISSISPSSGAQGTTLNISVTGSNTNFANGISVGSFSGTGITVNSTVVTSVTSATINASIAANATLGSRDVTVTTGSEIALLPGGFQVTAAACYTLSQSANPSAGGTVTINTPQNCSSGYTSGTAVSVTATPATNYIFSGWSGSGGTFSNSTSASTTFTISGNATVMANFTFGPPDAAVLLWPSGSIPTPTPAFSWNAAPRSTWYYLWVNDATMSPKILQWYTSQQVGCASGTGTCSVSSRSVLAQGAARWWIQTWNDYGYGPWSSGMAFTVSGNLPGAATLVSPSGAIYSKRPTYTWNAVPNATWYYLWVSDSTGTKVTTWYTAAQAGCASGTGTCSVNPSVTLATGAAQWWIQTWNDNGYGPWSSGMAFTVSGSLPGAATLVSPSGAISTKSPTYTWNAVPSATWYYLWVSDSTGTKVTTWYTAAQAGCASGTGTCSVNPSVTLATGAAQWWIQTWNDNGYGPWSTGMTFIVP